MSHRRVILLIESWSAYGRRCLLGVARYARLHGRWTFWHNTQYMRDRRLADHLAQWRGDGIISRIEDSKLLESVRALGLPMVDVRGAVRVPGSPCIGTDPVGVVSMALEHLNAKGYPHVAFAGRPGVDFSDARQQAFVQLAGVERGSVYPGETPQPRRQPRIHFDDEYRSPRRMAMQRWLASLPKPVGVVACHDMFGKYLLEACAAAELRVPYDVGVVGVDNDEVICELADPPLSSVAPHVEAMGYDAARTLEAMMNGEPVDPGERLIAPSGVQQRASTDTTAVQDEDLTRAISYIDQHIDAGVNVGQVADHMALSRSSLERRFRDHLNCTPREYILRRRIGRIRQLLRDPHLNVGDVARRCGFRNASHMIALFHAQTGQTPSQYRRGIA